MGQSPSARLPDDKLWVCDPRVIAGFAEKLTAEDSLGVFDSLPPDKLHDRAMAIAASRDALRHSG